VLVGNHDSRLKLPDLPGIAHFSVYRSEVDHSPAF